MIVAYYTPATKTFDGAISVYKLVSGHRTPVATMPCDNKREARALAASFNAQPWNF